MRGYDTSCVVNHHGLMRNPLVKYTVIFVFSFSYISVKLRTSAKIRYNMITMIRHVFRNQTAFKKYTPIAKFDCFNLALQYLLK